MKPSKSSERWRLIGFVGAFVLSGFAFIAIFPNIPHNHPTGYDQLMSAIDKKDVKTVESILNNGFDPNTIPHEQADYTAEDDISPLNSAAQDGSTEIVKILLDHGANPNLGDGWSYNPLSAATQNENLKTMTLLIKRGAKVNDEFGNSYALWRATMDGKVKSTNFLLDHGANPKSNLSGSLLDALKETHSKPEIIQIIENSLKSQAKQKWPNSRK